MKICEGKLSVFKNNRRWKRGTVTVPTEFVNDLECKPQEVMVIAFGDGEELSIPALAEKVELFLRVKESRKQLEMLKEQL